jgi:hypothetical protein
MFTVIISRCVIALGRHDFSSFQFTRRTSFEAGAGTQGIEERCIISLPVLFIVILQSIELIGFFALFQVIVIDFALNELEFMSF